ncbi:MAG: hypothetical protein WAQ25_01580 [Candidatus Saccharimonas sp.]
MAVLDRMPNFILVKKGNEYEVFTVLGVSVVALSGLYYSVAPNGVVTHHLDATVTWITGKTVFIDRVTLRGRFVESLITHGIGSYWSCAVAVVRCGDHAHLAAVVPNEYAHNQPLYYL